jgi:required for meiotic nuclear division protein 1
MLSSMLSVTLRHALVFNNFKACGSTTAAWHPPRIIASVISQRGYASETTSPPPQGSFKPKAHTPLRRTASDSLSIRANPKPTQSEIKPIFTLATSERYLLTRLRSRLPPTARPLHDAYWVPKWRCEQEEGHREGEVFIFNNGSFVCWGLSEDDAMRFRKDVLAPAGAEVKPLAEPETEELEFATDPSECVYGFFFLWYSLSNPRTFIFVL